MGKFWRRKRNEVSAAELDLRLLSEKASQSFKNSKFDLFLAKYNLVTAWVTFLMIVSYGLQITALAAEELSSFQVSTQHGHLSMSSTADWR